MIILDTDVLSGLMRADQAALLWVDRQPSTEVWTTAITLFEIRYGLAVMPAGRRHRRRLAEFDRMIVEDFEHRVLAFNEEAATRAAALMAERHRAGRPRDVRDTMIAGIVLAQRATLATRNTRHFDDLDVPVVDPWRA